MAELDVSRPELGERGGEPAGAVFGARTLDDARERDGGLRRQRQRPRVDQREHAFAREHETGARQTGEMGDAGDHNFQPECSATTPAVMVRERDAAEARRLDHLGEDRRLGKLADRFDQILVGLAVAGDRFADARDHIVGINVVERAQARQIDGGKLQAEKTPAELEHAMGFAERSLDARHVADAEGDGDAIEAPVGIGQLLGIALREADRLVEPAFARAFAADGEHVFIDVADGDTRAGAAGLHHAEGHVAGAAGEIEQREIAAGSCGGCTAVSSASFQARCRPPDIRSFIRS